MSARAQCAAVALAIAIHPWSDTWASEPAGAPADAPVHAPADATPDSAAADSDTAVALARTLFDRGVASYEAADYATAVELWSSAYGLMAGVPSMVAARRVLAFDLAQAQMRAYDQDGDRARLTAARPLLESYVAWVDRPGHTMNEAEREDRPRAVELLARISIEEGPPPAAFVAPTSAATDPVRAPGPPAERRRPKGTGLIVGGSLSLGASAALAAVAGALTVRGRRLEEDYVRAVQAGDTLGQEQAEFQGRRANAGMIASAALSATLGVAGIAMVSVGAVRRRQSRTERQVAIHPVLAPTLAGMGVHMSF